MKTFVKIVIGLIFAPLLMLVIILWTLQYQLLNPGFLLNSLSVNGAYEQVPLIIQSGIKEMEQNPSAPPGSPEEPQNLKDIASRVTPELAREFIDTNINNFMGYINGDKKDLEVYFPRSKLGLPVDPENPTTTSDTLPSSVFAPNGGLSIFHNIDEVIRQVWFIVILLFISLVLLYARLSHPWTKIYTLFLGTGASLLITSIVAQVFFVSANTELLKPGQEPAQHLMGILFGSILKDIAISWMWVGISLIAFSIILLIIQKTVYKHPIIHKPPKSSSKLKPQKA